MRTTHKPRADALLNELATLYMEKKPFLGHYAWHWEEERWHEMLVCALVSAGASPEQARSAVRIFDQLKMADPGSMARADEGMTQNVLARQGLDHKQVNLAVQTLTQTAKTCMDSWAGKPHLFLREMSKRWVITLSESFGRFGMSHGRAELLSTLWLQNVCNAPLLASNLPAVRAFCKDAGTTVGELIEAADSVGLNVAILDELLLMRLEHSDRPAVRMKTGRQKKVGRSRPTSRRARGGEAAAQSRRP